MHPALPPRRTGRARAYLALALLAACGGGAHGAPPVATTEVPCVPFGPLRLCVATSRRASEFHAVDQLSAWYPYHHRAYQVLGAEPPWTADEQAALDRQRAIRATHPWGRGLEQAFYLGRPGALDAATTASELDVLGALAPRLAGYLDAVQPHVEHFAAGLAAPIARGDRVLSSVGRLMGAAPRELPVAIVARPGRGAGGGGANGGVLVIEVTVDEASTTALIHEASHALMEHQRAAIADAAARCGDGLDAMTLEEGLAHAIAPGLVHEGSDADDPLAQHVARDATASLDGLVRFYALGLAVRPALVRALATGTLAGLFDAGCSAWASLRARRATGP